MYATMYITRLVVCSLAGLLLDLTVVSHPSEPPAENQTVVLQPFLRLEKPTYVLGEVIRFWVGVTPRGATLIPTEFRRPCTLTITKPDGNRRLELVGWPEDGMLDHGWSGGWGLGDEEIEEGNYTLVLECANEKTAPVNLTVERREIFDQIKAQFRFERVGAVTKATHVPIVLSVQNDTQTAIQFPQRGAMMEGITVRIVHNQPPSVSELFFPWDKLTRSNAMPDTYTWDIASEVPSVALRSGQRFEQRFLLEDAYSFDQAGDYEVTFSTVLSVLVGNKHGQFAKLCPIRLPVRANGKFVIE